MATVNLGRIKPVYRGVYNNSTAYVVDDMVQYTDSGILSTYICTTASQGNAPSSSGTAHGSWAYLAKGVAEQTVDLSGIKSDITALGIREATNEASAAFNLPNSFIDTFTNDSNLATKTNVGVSNGVLSTSSKTGGYDSNTIFLIDGVDASNPFRDLVNNLDPNVNDLSNTGGTPVRDTSNSKWGSNAVIDLNNGNLQYDISNSNTGWDGSGAYTVEFWQKHISVSGRDRYWGFRSGNDTRMTYGTDYGSSADFNGYSEMSGTGHEYPVSGTFDLESGNSNWNHFRYVRGGGAGSTHYYFFNGTLVGSRTQTSGGADNQTINSGKFDVNGRISSNGNGSEFIDAYITDFMVHKGAKSTANFSVPTAKAGSTFNATGTGIMSANTVGSSKTKVSGTMMYKDASGTATLGTDLKIYFTCNGGTNWTEASSYNAITPVYSTGVKQVRLGETTCTAGTDIRYKAVWANQASGSKETQLHAIGINY